MTNSESRTATASLIERLEKATSPERELDGLIYGLLRGLKRNGGTFEIGDKFQFEHPTLRHPNGPGALYVHDSDVPEFTASIDAALTLVPDRMAGWRVGRGDISWAVVCEGYRDGDRNHTVQAATPAIALCVAALEARAQSAVGDPEIGPASTTSA